MALVLDEGSGLACLAVLILACFGPVLLGGQQFAYRDGAHFYYPLYERVQREWREGRIPLWEMEENAGMPLLANPAAAVLYPGKLIYAVFPYPWAARLYVVAHVLLAFAGMRALLRHWEVTPAGAAIGGLAYAFGGPVLFQYCNIIFLVGAAWMPWGFRAADRMVRQGRRRALPELAVVLALQVLGGDPEAAYLTAVCAAGYALWVTRGGGSGAGRGRAWIVGMVLPIVWIAAVLAVAHLRLRGAVGFGGKVSQGLVVAVWALVGATFAWRWRRRRGVPPAGRALLTVAAASALALVLAAVQLVPTIEFTALSIRAQDDSLHEVYPFSVEPCRVFELIWPHVFGTMLGSNRYWLPLVPPKHPVAPWSLSLYLGAATLVLALGGAGFRSASPWRGWMTAVAVLSFTAALGEFGSPLWWVRYWPAAEPFFGAHDIHDGVNPLRDDGTLRDGDGSLYGLLAAGLPGFRLFRYPGKLLTLSCLAVSVLAGMGWDQVAAGRARLISAWAAALLAITLALLAAVVVGRGWLASILAARAAGGSSELGPFDLPGALAELRWGLAQAATVLALVLVLVRIARRSPRLAAALVLPLVTLDLAAANATLVVTLPQAVFDARPMLQDVIDQAEKARPMPGPFRIHRMALWNPIGWYESGAPDRTRALVAWRRATLEPKYGLRYDREYTLTEGTSELDDYRWFFHPLVRTFTPEVARNLSGKPGDPIVYFPRRGFDIWNTRYFVVPACPAWSDPHRGIVAFLPDSELVAPRFGGSPDDLKRWSDWSKREDWQVLRNPNALPRAWVVHQARRLPPAAGSGPLRRQIPIKEILYPGDSLWGEPGRQVFDPRTTAWLDAGDMTTLGEFVSGGPPTHRETVTVRYHGPQRVDLEAHLDRPGLVILSDVHFPGWRLTIDGRPATILRVNRLMRGAAVSAGLHRLSYTYEPWSFPVGLAITAAGLVAAALLWLRGRRP